MKNKTDNTLTLFSGDAFSPSTLGLIYEGQQMVKPLNSINIDVACCGNHDFDFSLKITKQLFCNFILLAQTNFPWLLSNVYDKRTKKRIANVGDYIIK